MNGKKLYVGGLPYSVSDSSLEQLFTEFGTVESARVVTDRMDGRSRGFGFVEMSSPTEAQTSIDRMNGTQLEGRTLTVNEARDRNSGGDDQSRSRDRW
jgi:RNA recognition motif-containing protein